MKRRGLGLLIACIFMIFVPFVTLAQEAGQIQGGAQGAGPSVPQQPSLPQQPSVPQQPTSVAPQLKGAELGAEAKKAMEKVLSPEQAQTLEGIMKERGGLTPEAIEQIKTRPEFQGLSVEDVIKGREELKKQKIETPEKGEKEAPTKEAPPKVEITPPEQESLFHKYRRVGAYSVSVSGLRTFGTEFFREATVKVITERKDIPVPEEYVIGPGDEVKVVMWGRVNAQYNLIVDRNGNITIPQLGPIRVAGLSFKDMASYLIDQTKQIVGANVDITMGGLKSIPVFVLGDVLRPGAYMVGPFSTITDALIYAGGPNNLGSMRRIELRRNGTVLTTYDLYDLFLKGDKSKDLNLQAGDVVFVPVCGPLVGIAGNVRRPAIYELKDKRDLKTLIQMAGGVTPSADIQRIQVERIKKSEAQIVLDIGYKDLERAREFELQDGDLVKVFPIVDQDLNAVYLHGNVKRPGKYELKNKMRVSDVVRSIEDLLPETYYEYALIKRLTLPDLSPKLIPINLGRVIFEKDPSFDILLSPQDQIYIFSKWFFEDRPYVEVRGEVRKPGRFELSKNTTIKDAILLAGGITRKTYMDLGELYRTDKETGQITLIKFNPKKAMEGDEANNLLVKDLDKIVLHSIEEVVSKKIVTISGEVMRPGDYPYAENMTVKDLVFAAGNILDSAYLEEAELTRQIIVDGKVARYQYQTINLEKALKGDPTSNIKLEPFDILFVRKITKWRVEEYATISGEVMFPGKYAIRPGERVSSLIERAGGFTENAYLRGAIFTRERTKQLQQRALDEMISRLERELVAASSVSISTASSGEELEAKKAQSQSISRFIQSLKELKAQGRMTIHIAPLRLLKGSEYDIELQNGDALHIPTKNEVINVVGAVMAQGSFIYKQELSWKDYISMAGGYADYADTDNVYVLKVDGSAIKVGGGGISWNPLRNRWELTVFGEKIKGLEAGDTIVVPEKLTRIAWLREVKDITQILMQMALTAGTVIKVF